MKIKVNGEEYQLEGSSVAQLAAQMRLPDKGVAIAVGMQMVPRSEWETTQLAEGAEIIVIKAASGG